MKNLSGNADSYAKAFDNGSTTKRTRKQPKESVKVLSESEVAEFVAKYEELLNHSERLYEMKTSKELSDIRVVLGSLKRDIRMLAQNTHKS